MSGSVARLRQRYLAALENMRGLADRLRAAELNAAARERRSVKDVSLFSVTAASDLLDVNRPKEPLRDDPKLDFAAAQCLDALARCTGELLLRQPECSDPEKSRLVVGMSGGADSTLVLLLACRLRDLFGFSARAVHCIHGLDPDDDIWLEHNRSLCARLDVELLTPVLDIVYGNGVSPEDASRRERYRALLENLNKNSDFLCLGHQADDQVESLMLALKRGAGPKGLSAMRLITRDARGVILRPLLDLRKTDVEQILISSKIDYVYDLSNAYLKFERNYMRLKVLPTLRRRFSGFDATALRTVRLCGMEHDLCERYVSERIDSCLVSLPHVPLPALRLLDSDLEDEALSLMLIRAFLRRCLDLPSVEFSIVENCRSLLLSDHDSTGLVKTPARNLAVSRFKNMLCIRSVREVAASDLPSGSFEIEADLPLSVAGAVYSLRRLDAAEKSLLRAPCSDDPDNVRGRAFRLRSPVATLCFDFSGSLKFKPRRRSRSREIKKILAEQGIVPWLRPFMPLVRDPDGTALALGDVCAAGEDPFSDFTDADLDSLYILVVNLERVEQNGG